MRSVDLRSDTVTMPVPAMKEAMMSALAGDDVFGEDSAVNELERKCAAMFGMEAGLFCPSGTMANQIAIRMHTSPQDELICDANSHVHVYEGGGIAFHSGVSVKTVQGDRGRIRASDVEENISPDNVHYPHTSLVCIENTCNRGGGSIYDPAEIARISEMCRWHGLKLHLDGARIFNAITETGEDPTAYGKTMDSMSVCLSKGLGAPVGSLLLSTSEKIRQARRIRKVMGGGMRQAGYIAAAGIYALEHHVGRLKDDHRRAREMAAALQHISCVAEIMPVQTNIVVFRLEDGMPQDLFLSRLQKQGILAIAFGRQTIRMVTHLDIADDDIERAVRALVSL
jgi:threonine aldolase